jgi:hypothetical protein
VFVSELSYGYGNPDRLVVSAPRETPSRGIAISSQFSKGFCVNRTFVKVLGSKEISRGPRQALGSPSQLECHASILSETLPRDCSFLNILTIHTARSSRRSLVGWISSSLTPARRTA